MWFRASGFQALGLLGFEPLVCWKRHCRPDATLACRTLRAFKFLLALRCILRTPTFRAKKAPKLQRLPKVEGGSKQHFFLSKAAKVWGNPEPEETEVPNHDQFRSFRGSLKGIYKGSFKGSYQGSIGFRV